MPEYKLGLDVIGEQERARLVKTALYFVRDHADAEDVVQAVLLKAWVHRREFRGESTAMTYLISAVRNEALMMMRKPAHKLRASASDAVAFERIASREIPVERRMAARMELQRVLQVLPVKFARVAALAEEPYDFSAALLGTTRCAVKLRMHRMRVQLRSLRRAGSLRPDSGGRQHFPTIPTSRSPRSPGLARKD